MLNYLCLSNGDNPTILKVNHPSEIPDFIKGKYEILEKKPPYIFLLNLPKNEPDNETTFLSLIHSPENEIFLAKVLKERVAIGLLRNLTIYSAENKKTYLVSLENLSEDLGLVLKK